MDTKKRYPILSMTLLFAFLNTVQNVIASLLLSSLKTISLLKIAKLEKLGKIDNIEKVVKKQRKQENLTWLAIPE